MPGMDKTGPFGTGPVGREMGPCSGGVSFQQGKGRGMGRGFRRGGGFGRFLPPIVSKEGEKDFLEKRKNWLKSQLEAVEKLLETINKSEN
ncbi:DUF5320 domain-containing protein [uncultured Anaerolinea sp.]|uniref:DUF5320 domain-containing protein n=2 Tax=Anaerolineaceae TaxID=292628 RepID=UPI00344735C5